MNNAKFKATLVDFKVNGKKTVLKLELSNTDASRNFGFLVGSLDDDVLVQLGDPQVSMDELGVSTPHTGISYNVQPDGTVESAQEELDLEDESETDADEAEHEEGDQEKPDDLELDFDEDEAASDQDAAGDSIAPKDEVEAWILSGKSFGDEEVDWEALLKRKKAGETWMVIANSIHTSSSKLSTAWSKYKDRVKAYLSGEEHGAA